ncbi:MAG: hypothetical protein ABSF59_11795 [Candidatus Sulfotelmatobacter sp.]|jgi:hypothetical protein
MSTSAVSNSSIYQHLQQYFQSRSTDLGQLGQALSSGDLSSAQTAFNKIVSLGQNGPFANGTPFKLTDREQDFTAVGQALQSGDLAGAQQAFASLVDTFNNPQGANLGGEFKPAPTPASLTSGAGPEFVVNLTNTGTAANPEQITINLGAAGNGGAEQISISAGTQLSPDAQQITLNLNPSNSENIVLNLLNSSSSSTVGSSPAGGGLSVSA